MNSRLKWLIIAVEVCACAALPALLGWVLFAWNQPDSAAPISRPPDYSTTRLPDYPTTRLEVVTLPRPTLSPTPTPSPEPLRYIVREGDTLWGIAAGFHLELEVLIAANPALDPDHLTPGQAVIIPLTPTLAALADATERPPADTATPEPLTPTPPIDSIGGTPTLPGPVMGQVAADGEGLRLRETPGTAGNVLLLLDPFTPLTLVGRTADEAWLEVFIPAGEHGWVMARYVELFVAAADLPTTGQAVDLLPPAAATPIVQLAQPTQPTQPTPGGASTPPAPGTQTAAATPPPAEPTAPAPTATPIKVYAPVDGNGNYPYISNLTERARQIFLAGQGLGNRPDVFSKVGDSITVSPSFFTPIGFGQYNLQDHAYLQPAIDYFSQTVARDANSFANTSLAAKGGWSAWTVINPYLSQEHCREWEKPIVCEYRQVKPAVALIMLGTNDVKTTSLAVYERYMRETIQISIDMGVIPVISTIPEFHRSGVEGRVAAINNVLAGLSNEYSIPLWNYWAALQGLPNDGLSSDGIHPSVFLNHAADFAPEYLQYGYTVRNLTGLQALDAVWRGVIRN